MAQYIFQDLVNKAKLQDAILIDSMATSSEEIGNGIYPNARIKLLENNIHGFENHRAKRFTRKDYDTFDYVIVMDEENLYGLRWIIGNDDKKKVYKLLDFTNNKGDVEDPWYTRNFDKVFNEIDNGCKCLLEYLKQKI